ncbi:MAG: hypothetical protein ACXAC8_14400 [Candidatus Hodarchaeales archaeon]|jgi:hypothetical protein
MNWRYFLVTLILIFSSSIIISIQGVQSEWSSTITVKSYHWKALKSELRDLKTNEQYRHNDLIGGINIPGGDNAISLNSLPSTNFDLFNGDRLDIDVTVEGDMVISITQNSSDFHLLLLPIKTNDHNFFTTLFEEKKLLENLTHSIYLNSTISETTAVVNLKYNNTLDVRYEWDTINGQLTRKEVTAPSGLQLIVIPGRGSSMPGWSLIFVLLTILGVAGWEIKRRKE